jgi:hypothetical protein
MNLLAWLRRYAAHPDPATAAANTVALVVAGNGPFYPLYVVMLIGGGWGVPSLTMLATPFFFAIPALSHRNGRLGRAALPLVGIANSVWCAFLLGEATYVGLFLLPCIILAGLLFRAEERIMSLLLMGLALTALIGLVEFPPAGLGRIGAQDAAALARLNTVSVGTLTGFLGLTFAGVLRGFAPPAVR